MAGFDWPPRLWSLGAFVVLLAIGLVLRIVAWGRPTAKDAPSRAGQKAEAKAIQFPNGIDAQWWMWPNISQLETDNYILLSLRIFNGTDTPIRIGKRPDGVMRFEELPTGPASIVPPAGVEWIEPNTAVVYEVRQPLSEKLKKSFLELLESDRDGWFTYDTFKILVEGQDSQKSFLPLPLSGFCINRGLRFGLLSRGTGRM